MSQSITCPNCQYGISIETPNQISSFNRPKCSFNIELSTYNKKLIQKQNTKNFNFSIINCLLSLINLIFIIFVIFVVVTQTFTIPVGVFILLLIMLSLFNIYNLLAVKMKLLQTNLTINAIIILLFVFVGSIDYSEPNTMVGVGGMVFIMLASVLGLIYKSKKQKLSK